MTSIFVSSKQEFKTRQDIRRYISARWGYLMNQLELQLKLEIERLRLDAKSMIVDYGCADQPYRALLPASAKYVGADLKGNDVANIEIQADGTLPLNDNVADLVLSTQVLEHVDDPRKYLAEALRILKPQGHLILSTHGIFKYHGDPTDYWRWTHTGLRHEVARAGFEVEEMRGIVGAIPAGFQYMMDHVVQRINSPTIKRFLYWFTQSCVSIADRMYSQQRRNNGAWTFIVRARKLERA